MCTGVHQRERKGVVGFGRCGETGGRGYGRGDLGSSIRRYKINDNCLWTERNGRSKVRGTSDPGGERIDLPNMYHQ